MSAMEGLNDIYEEHERLLEKQEDASIDVGKAQLKEQKAVDKLELAKQHLASVSGIGAKKTDEENLAIARQQQRVDELIAIEEKSELQKFGFNTAGPFIRFEDGYLVGEYFLKDELVFYFRIKKYNGI